MKFHAQSSPPACGPTIYPTAAKTFLSRSNLGTQHILPYHRDDGCFAQVSAASGDHHGVDRVRLLIEDGRTGRVLLVPWSTGEVDDSWGFPMCDAADDPNASILDVCNVIGAAVRYAKVRPPRNKLPLIHQPHFESCVGILSLSLVC